MGDQVDRFCRQYLQLERDLEYPDGAALRDEATQEVLYERLFADGAGASSTPPRYQLRALKEIVARIESSITDWEVHVSGKRSSRKSKSRGPDQRRESRTA